MLQVRKVERRFVEEKAQAVAEAELRTNRKCERERLSLLDELEKARRASQLAAEDAQAVTSRRGRARAKRPTWRLSR